MKSHFFQNDQNCKNEMEKFNIGSFRFKNITIKLYITKEVNHVQTKMQILDKWA